MSHMLDNSLYIVIDKSLGRLAVSCYKDIHIDRNENEDNRRVGSCYPKVNYLRVIDYEQDVANRNENCRKYCRNDTRKPVKAYLYTN